MTETDPFPRFPDHVPAGKQTGARVWTKLPGYYAVVDRDAQTIEVLPGTPPPGSFDPRHRPVYGMDGESPKAAPTGRVYLRLSPSVVAESRSEQIARAGFTVDRLISYAPHSVWLRASSGDAADALASAPALARMPDVENVEPQMLSVRAPR